MEATIKGSELSFFKGKNNSLYIKAEGIDLGINPKQENYLSLNELRDEYHSIGELYEFRKAYNALLFNEWAKIDNIIRIKNRRKGLGGSYKEWKDVHKSWRHHDGELCFGGGWFIVVAMLPDGQITNHYKAEDWDLFQIPETDKAKYEYDGHTPADTLVRMNNLLKLK
jgi:hypothetical protein